MLTNIGLGRRLQFCHAGLDPRFDRLTTLSEVEGESSVLSNYLATGCRSTIPSLAGMKSGMTFRYFNCKYSHDPVIFNNN
jgi:hypothetical protein